ncbi:hypothetical protein hrd7_10380 [Leptolinea sp. HRD-7]|nr:hypothetical protein hrd7_10380 [Leptolinea sp. HRD-7]
MKHTKFSFMSIVAIITLLVLALGSSSQVVLAADSDPNKPGNIPNTKVQTVHDQTNEKTANDKYAFGGDVFGLGWYERPFDQNMGYLPFIDLSKILMTRVDPNWVYVKLFMAAPVADGKDSKPLYGIEMDTDLDNRGEFLLLTGIPTGTEWSTEGVMIMSNSDNNMGGSKPVLPDTSIAEGKGYDTEVFNAGKGDDPNLAWARVSPDDPKCIDIAFKSSFIGGAKGKFIWLSWALVGIQDLTKFEFNDHFTKADAGSPLKEDKDLYPIKGIWGVDNTPRIPSGFEPGGLMPGLAQNFQPKP